MNKLKNRTKVNENVQLFDCPAGGFFMIGP